MGKWESAPAAAEIFDLLRQKKGNWKPADDFSKLPGYRDAENREHDFLAALSLTKLELPEEPGTDSLSFTAVMDKASLAFLEGTLCEEWIDDRNAVLCQMQWYEEDIKFAVVCQFENREIQISGMRFCVSAFTFSSGICAGSLYVPQFSYICQVKNSLRFLGIKVRSYPGEKRLFLEGRYEGTDNLTIRDVLSLFGMDAAAFQFADFLPACLEAELFENLGLHSMTAEADAAVVRSMSLEVSAKKAWAVTEDISIMPTVRIFLACPFDSARRSLSFRVSGDWQLGQTWYEISAEPFRGELSLRMKEGETLDFGAACARFLHIKLPDIKIDVLSASLNFLDGSGSFLMHAADLWKFSILGREFSMESAELRVWLQKGSYDVVMSGSFRLLDAGLNLACRFTGDDSYSIDASAADDTGIKLTSYVNEFLDSAKVSAAIPEEFLDFGIHNLQISYDQSKEDSLFVCSAAVEHVLAVTDQFVIDNFSLTASVHNGVTERIELQAAACIAGCGILLEFTKKEGGLCFKGGTGEGQGIPAGELLEDFLGGMLGYQVDLPESLRSFFISHIGFTYEEEKEKTSFRLDCSAVFQTGGKVLDILFSSGVHVVVDAVKSSGWTYGFLTVCEIVLAKTQILTCEYRYDGTAAVKENVILLAYEPENPEDGISFGEILSAIGFTHPDDSWAFLTHTKINRARIEYEFVKNEFSALLEISGGGSLQVRFICQDGMDFCVTMISGATISLADLPVVGGLAGKFISSAEDFALSDITFHALSPLYAQEEHPAGIRITFRVCGEEKSCQLYEYEKKEQIQQNAGGVQPKTVWIQIEKTIVVFALHRMGISLDGSSLGILMDASLNVSPLTFDMMGLGMHVDMGDFKKIGFTLSGLGISLETEALSLSGSFMRTREQESGADAYAGSLALSAGGISAFAAGQYSEGALMAFACVNAALGGPPACFIRGFAAGFGYNETLILPPIEEVPSCPLIAGAMGRIGREELSSQLSRYITPSQGQFFLAAGVRFTSFEIADSVVLATVSFGKKLQIGLLGQSNMSMPPHCDSTPVAYACLALKAAFLPDDGVVSVEALLTSESYVLSRDCKLTGGFAFRLWFGGEHAGDFVITLGGYHPAYQKPEHYPDVPRLGFHWDVIPAHPNRLVISGEMYFALTPSAIMAGGMLSAVYAHGNLRAWFAARADFLICWKPFHYDIEIGISLGASYRIDIWFVHCTFKVELGCDLHLWGPDFSGEARISWFIISFTIRFGAGADRKAKKLEWREFAESFLPKDESVNPLSAMVSEGVIGRQEPVGNGAFVQDGQEEEIPVVCPERFAFSFTTAFPCTEATVKGREKNICLQNAGTALFVRPMGKTVTESKLEAELTFYGTTGTYGEPADVIFEPIRNNVPSALWASEEYEKEMVQNALCGIRCTAKQKTSSLFPENSYISEEMLSDGNAIVKHNAFAYADARAVPVFETEETVHYVTETACRLKTEGKKFLERMGYMGECDLTFFAQDAENQLDEDIFVEKTA